MCASQTTSYFWSKVFAIKQCGNHNSIYSSISGACKILNWWGISNFVVDMHACVNTTDVKVNKFIHNKYSTGQIIYMLQNKTNPLSCRRCCSFVLHIPSWCSDQEAARPQPREPGNWTWKSYCRL